MGLLCSILGLVCVVSLIPPTQGLVKRAEQAKVAVFACGLEMSSTETKGTVLIRTGEELMSYNKVGVGCPMLGVLRAYCFFDDLSGVMCL